MLAATRERNPPPRPAMPPETSTATNLYRRTFTPRVSAATGDSPTERSRRPKAVRQSTHAVTPNRATASRVSTETLVTKPRRIPARSEMKKMCCCSRFPRASEMTGSETVGSSGSGHRGEEARREVLGGPCPDDVQRHTGDDVVDTEDHRGDGVDQTADHAR